MSKSILVVDTPESCFKCKLQDWLTCRFTKKCHIGSSRPDWCPLKEIPKKDVHDYLINERMNGYAEGWNACIDEILKECDEK